MSSLNEMKNGGWWFMSHSSLLRNLMLLDQNQAESQNLGQSDAKYLVYVDYLVARVSDEAYIVAPIKKVITSRFYFPQICVALIGITRIHSLVVSNEIGVKPKIEHRVQTTLWDISLLFSTQSDGFGYKNQRCIIHSKFRP